MKRVLCALLVLVMCISLASPVFAAEESFVPSISYKDYPQLIPGTDPDGRVYIGIIRNAEGEIIDYIYPDDCLVITSVAQALKNATILPTEFKNILLDLYYGILNGSVKLPFADPSKWVIRDLIDVTFLCGDHPEMLEEVGVVLELTFDLGVAADVPVTVMTYKDGGFGDIHGVSNNGDGTVTCIFEHLCPVAFVVPVDATVEPPKTGDEARGYLGLWIGLMVVSAGAVVALVANRRKFNA